MADNSIKKTYDPDWKRKRFEYHLACASRYGKLHVASVVLSATAAAVALFCVEPHSELYMALLIILLAIGAFASRYMQCSHEDWASVYSGSVREENWLR